MKKLVSFALFSGLLLATQVSGAFADTHFKLSLVPGVATPKTAFVSGLDFGVLANQTNKVNGVQFSPFFSRVTEGSAGAQAALFSVSDNFDGAKWGLVSIARDVRGYHDGGLVCVSYNVIGYQTGFVSLSHSVKGVQTGFVNVTRDMSGLQVGLVNYTEAMNGLQIGLINIITQSSIAATPIVNWHFE